MAGPFGNAVASALCPRLEALERHGLFHEDGLHLQLVDVGAVVDELTVKTILVEQAMSLKRFQARAKGRGNRITKRTCHIFVTVADDEKKKAPAKPAKK